jgi:two-component system, cell cycle response regulator DivK
MKTVLILEDNEQNAYLARFILEKHGCQVVVAHDGPSGIEMANQIKPSLVLLDIQLPGMDGYEVARRMRLHENLNKMPIVAVTSYAMVGDRERVMEAGCTGYLEKPINPDTFMRDIFTFLNA